MKVKYLSVLLFLFLLPGGAFADCTLSSIGMNNTVSGVWGDDCLSTHRFAAFARFYTFTLESSQTVTIDLESTRSTYLILLSGSGTDGSIVGYDSASLGKNSQLVTYLGRGTYTIEATTYQTTTTGSFTVSLSNDAPPPVPCNIGLIDIGSSVSGSWSSSSCVDESERYSEYFSFRLLETQELTIDLDSSQDTYLALLKGPTAVGSEITSNRFGPNRFGSQIVITLEKGDYTIQASSWNPRSNGNFVLSMNVTVPNCEDSINPIAIDTNVAGSWTSDCVDESDRYSRYFTFTLLETREVTIDLNSSEDTFLALLSGSDTEGSEITTNTINPNGPGSQIVVILDQGDYTIQTSSLAPGTSGDFVVSLSAVIPGCGDDCPFLINTHLDDVWFNTLTNGQGFLIIVYPQMKELFMAWFTFDVERPPEDAVAILGGPGQRWLTAQGPYDGDTATLSLYTTAGGVFDSAAPDAEMDVADVGTVTVEFANCEEGFVTYEITSLGLSGEIPIQRVVNDNVPACEAFIEEFWATP